MQIVQTAALPRSDLRPGVVEPVVLLISRQIDPTMDTGVDFAAEYKAAMEMQGK